MDGSLVRFELGADAPLPSGSSPLDLRSHIGGEPDPELELCVGSIGHPEVERFTDPSSGLLECPSVGVAPGNVRHSSEPSSRLIPDDVDAVGQRNHFLPMQGSRSLSIARIVPGAMSAPAWTGGAA